MLYRLEERVEGVWKFLREISSWASWEEVAARGRGSFRLVHPKTGVAEREIHMH